MSLTCHEEIGRVGRVDEDVTRMRRGCYEETAPVEYRFYAIHQGVNCEKRTVISSFIALCYHSLPMLQSDDRQFSISAEVFFFFPLLLKLNFIGF